MLLFALNTTRPLGERIAAHASIALASHEEREFEDTEFKVRSLEDVAGELVFVCQSLYADEVQSANDKLVRLLFFIGALKDARASRVVALLPYLAFARKDRRTKARDPLSLRYVAALFEAVGTDTVAALDVHNPAAFENAFRCPTIHVEPTSLFVEHFMRAVVASVERVVVLSPDAGGMKRARTFAAALAARSARPIDLALMEKGRSEGRVSGDAFAGEVRDAAVIILDDLISGGTTMARAARAARARGARTVHAAATHGVFASGAEEALQAAGVDSIVVTDSVGDPRLRAGALPELAVLQCAPLFAPVLRDLAPSESR